ncbi:MAG TPA: endolytic transglycosylase MltG [Gemmatimonadales bacterium]|nr:endolytic transglycosylase MltG [Gemmatimonadales bacterium]
MNRACAVRRAASSGRFLRRTRHAARAVLVCFVVSCGKAEPARYQSVSEKTMVIIPRGATYYQALDSLESRGVIKNRDWFSLYARIRRLPSNLKSGVYTFEKDAGWSTVVSALKSGRGMEVRFTVLEGMMGFEVAERARSWLGVSRAAFTTAMRDTALQRELGIAVTPAGVEGYMYPTTYVVQMRMPARELVKLMVHEFIARWQPEWDARLAELKMTRHQIVTLASIIEAEVRYDPDRPYVSAVYHNRLKRGMALQADPTVVYAHGRRLRRVWEGQLRIKSPYNTYLNTGLPPGPINQPSDSSIYYALYPAQIGYLFFVAQPDGKHIFSANYTDHLAAIKRVRSRPATPARQSPAPARSAPRR